MGASRSRRDVTSKPEDLDGRARETDTTSALPRIHAELTSTDTPRDPIKLSVRITMGQILDVAEDVEVRAKMLEWSKAQMPHSDVARRVQSLHEAGKALRFIVAHLSYSWDEAGQAER